MVGSVFSRFAKSNALGTVAVRGAIVAVNFAVMIGLATFLGLGAFGELAVIWGLALVAGTVMSLGAPLMLLRRLTDGGGLHPGVLVLQVIVAPLALALVAFFVLNALFPDVAWMPVLAVGVGVTLITNLASIMRALGSVEASMVLRDAGPQVALGLGAVTFLGAEPALIAMQSLIWLGAMAALAGLWCVHHLRWAQLVRPDGARAGIAWSLWGTAVLGMVLAQVDIIVGGSLLSPEQIGLYAVLRRVANLVALPVSVATWVSAAPVSAAYGAGDLRALQRASAQGSQIAFGPGVALFCLAVAALPLLGLVIGQAPGPQGRLVFAVLLVGALIQVVFATSYTVATLCAQAHWAAVSRLLSVLCYLAAVWVMGPALVGPVENALIHAGAVALGSALLWYLVRYRLQVDTSAAVLLPHRAAGWRVS